MVIPGTVKGPGEQPVQFTNTELPDIIELKEIKQVYGNRPPIIKGFNLLIEDKPNQGQFIVLLGASGCGKSTILRYIAGLQQPTEGKVLIYGKERTPKDRVGMVFQQYSSFPWMSVLDNVALGLQYQDVPKRERRERAMEMIVKVGLEGHEDKYAQYPTLSGGQLQRVAIARSLLYERKILLMDEPFGALDIETRLQMQDLLAKIWVEIHPTVVFVTHDIPEAVYLGDDIYVMGRNPGNIKKMFVSPLPFVRNKGMKRETKFINMVNEIEDYMLAVGAAPTPIVS
jgi:NitT/TauT family transport system ATP-binding protein